MILKMINAKLDRQKLAMKYLNGLINFEERIRCNTKNAVCNSSAEVRILDIFSVFCCARVQAAFSSDFAAEELYCKEAVMRSLSPGHTSLMNLTERRKWYFSSAPCSEIEKRVVR